MLDACLCCLKEWQACLKLSRRQFPSLRFLLCMSEMSLRSTWVCCAGWLWGCRDRQVAGQGLQESVAVGRPEVDVGTVLAVIPVCPAYAALFRIDHRGLGVCNVLRDICFMRLGLLSGSLLERNDAGWGFGLFLFCIIKMFYPCASSCKGRRQFIAFNDISCYNLVERLTLCGKSKWPFQTDFGGR